MSRPSILSWLCKIVQSMIIFICRCQLVLMIVMQILKLPYMLDLSSQSTCISMTDPVQELVNLLKDISLSLRKTRQAAESIYDVVKTQMPAISSSLYEVEEKINGSINAIAPKQSSNPSESIAQSNQHQSTREKRIDQSKEEHGQVGRFPSLAHNRQVSKLSLEQGNLQKEIYKPSSQLEYRSQQALFTVPKTKKGTKHQDSQFSPLFFFDQLEAIQQKFRRIRNQRSDDKERHRDVESSTLMAIQLLKYFESWPISEKEAFRVVSFLKKGVEQILQNCRLSRDERIDFRVVWSRCFAVSLTLHFKLAQKSKQQRQQAREKRKK